MPVVSGLSRLPDGLKTWLRSTMLQKRFNSVSILNNYQERTDKIDIIAISNEFLCNKNCKRYIGAFTHNDLSSSVIPLPTSSHNDQWIKLYLTGALVSDHSFNHCKFCFHCYDRFHYSLLKLVFFVRLYRWSVGSSL